ncbi:hypothetical protein [Geoalkalibacter halelectricus]|uniref:hypothetical protein n=1 Tax=Geoalkalibacter halelectricus TaxID=2847045 RepID=UPI00266FA3D9|nr:hypothetical protein [Geoalkalibacter halelectricus]MDO3378510.1 hypothetical protein [Geoalkalibacter halelectricus]
MDDVVIQGKSTVVVGTTGMQGIAGSAGVALPAHGHGLLALQPGRVDDIGPAGSLGMRRTRTVAGFARNTDICDKNVLKISAVASLIIRFGCVPRIGIKTGSVAPNTALLPGAEFSIVVAARCGVRPGQPDLDEQEVVTGPILVFWSRHDNGNTIFFNNVVTDAVIFSFSYISPGHSAAVIINRVALLSCGTDNDGDLVEAILFLCKVQGSSRNPGVGVGDTVGDRVNDHVGLQAVPVVAYPGVDVGYAGVLTLKGRPVGRFQGVPAVFPCIICVDVAGAAAVGADETHLRSRSKFVGGGT